MKIRKYLFAVILSLTIPSAVMAAKGGRFIPDHFDVYGAVDGLYPAEGYIVVNDSVYYINSATRVRGKDAKAAKIDSLTTGQRVGFFTQSAGAHSPPIFEIWVLPRSWQDRHPDKDD